MFPEAGGDRQVLAMPIGSLSKSEGILFSLFKNDICIHIQNSFPRPAPGINGAANPPRPGTRSSPDGSCVGISYVYDIAKSTCHRPHDSPWTGPAWETQNSPRGKIKSARAAGCSAGLCEHDVLSSRGAAPRSPRAPAVVRWLPVVALPRAGI